MLLMAMFLAPPLRFCLIDIVLLPRVGRLLVAKKTEATVQSFLPSTYELSAVVYATVNLCT